MSLPVPWVSGPTSSVRFYREKKTAFNIHPHSHIALTPTTRCSRTVLFSWACNLYRCCRCSFLSDKMSWRRVQEISSWRAQFGQNQGYEGSYLNKWLFWSNQQYTVDRLNLSSSQIALSHDVIECWTVVYSIALSALASYYTMDNNWPLTRDSYLIICQERYQLSSHLPNKGDMSSTDFSNSANPFLS